MRSLRIVLDFENQGYVLDKPLPTALPEGSSPEEHLMFDKWLEDNRKVRSIILALMTNEIQKQYDRFKDVPSIMLRMKESHGVKMLSLVEKLEDLKAGLENDTYIDVILQSLPPSYDLFIVNYNMNGLEKSIHELTNILVQYEATTHKSETAVLVGEASTSKDKGKGARRWKRKKGKRMAVTATASTGGAPAVPTGKGKRKVGVLSGRWQMMCACTAKERGIGRGSVYNSSPTQSNLIMTAQHKCKVDDHENAQIWHAKLGHISKDRIRRLVDSKNLEIDDLNYLPTCKEKMTKKPFIGQSVIANGLLDLVHTDVCGPLSTPTRRGFSFKEYRLEVENQTNRKIKALRSGQSGEYLSGEFIDYLKENGILSQWTPPGTPELNGVAERRNRTLLDMVRSMMSFTKLPPRFWGNALETAAKLLNIAPSKTVPQTPYEIWHGKPTSYKYLRVWGSPPYVKRLVGDNLDSRSSLCRFIRYSKETAGYYFYDPAEQKIFFSRKVVFLEKCFPSDNRRDEALIKESSEELQHDSTTSFEPMVHTDGVPVFRRSTRESQVPERYGFMGLTIQLDKRSKDIRRSDVGHRFG
ncbi:UNVERIFIED_CONTAM: hypothetical protein Slati_3721100 [Sesamum latifolium]|uniref:Integrase catalytic domain-containing protein n=1 Tax=Sesamum latifolium TaxID=2727402 RepID=A0AAW2U382_9LAMI